MSLSQAHTITQLILQHFYWPGWLKNGSDLLLYNKVVLKNFSYHLISHISHIKKKSLQNTLFYLECKFQKKWAWIRDVRSGFIFFLYKSNPTKVFQFNVCLIKKAPTMPQSQLKLFANLYIFIISISWVNVVTQLKWLETSPYLANKTCEITTNIHYKLKINY